MLSLTALSLTEFSRASAIIAADVRRFGHVSNKDGVLGTHKRRRRICHLLLMISRTPALAFGRSRTTLGGEDWFTGVADLTSSSGRRR